jgi:membrane protein DedA with SNARE-associated domain
VLDNKGIPLKFIDAIKDMHYGAIFIARMIGGAKTKFSFMIGFKISICI